MEKETAKLPGQTGVRSDYWSLVRDTVIGVDHHIGMVKVAEGYRIDASGRKQGGAFITVDWIVRDDFHSATLFKCEDGRSVFLRDSMDHVFGRKPKNVFECLDAPPYSSRDPILDVESLTAVFVQKCGDRFVEIADQLRPIVAQFLKDYYEPEILNPGIGRAVTGTEYAYLSVSPTRRQAAVAMPWLLPYISMHVGSGSVIEVMRTIDEQAELIPSLAARFGVQPNVIRSMSVFPAWHPLVFKLGELMSVDAPCIALALSKMPPEQRPEKDMVSRFMKVLKWVEVILRETTGQASRRLVAAATAEVWQRLRRRPYSLPSYHEVSWLEDLASAVKDFPSLPQKATPGTLFGKEKSFHPHVWAVAYCLCRYHPTDLAAVGREWRRREMAYQRHHVRASFPAGFTIGSHFPDAHTASNGWEIRRIASVGELCEESSAASNCLAGYLPALIRRTTAVFCLIDPEGVVEGHFSLDPGPDEELSIGQVKRYRNRKASAQMVAASQEFLFLMKDTKGMDYPDPLSSREAQKCGLGLAVTAVDAAKAIAHKNTVEKILNKAADYFLING
jgi:hypothetical protein